MLVCKALAYAFLFWPTATAVEYPPDSVRVHGDCYFDCYEVPTEYPPTGEPGETELFTNSYVYIFLIISFILAMLCVVFAAVLATNASNEGLQQQARTIELAVLDNTVDDDRSAGQVLRR